MIEGFSALKLFELGICVGLGIEVAKEAFSLIRGLFR